MANTANYEENTDPVCIWQWLGEEGGGKKEEVTNKGEKKKVIFFEKNLHSHSIPFVIMYQAVMSQFLFRFSQDIKFVKRDNVKILWVFLFVREQTCNSNFHFLEWT